MSISWVDVLSINNRPDHACSYLYPLETKIKKLKFGKLERAQFPDFTTLFSPDHPIDIGDVAQNYSGNFFADIRHNVIWHIRLHPLNSIEQHL